ncbi:MFS transporter [Desulfurococcus amylolyticus]|uniref:MFS transporter n=1 Tax=Desulfurococcus amylolyticus TaxID=94694 RepID=UPI0023F3DEED|nr:MFS transporter [Desulfurococcus amylolyticus]
MSHGKTVILFMALSLTMLYADQNLIAPMLKILEEDGMIPGIGTPNFWFYAGLLATVPTFAGIATTFIWGYLADKLNRRTLFATAVLIGEIPCFLTGFARNYYEMLFLRALTGIGINGAAPVARAIIADLYPPEKRGTGYAIYNFSSGFGVLIGMLMTGIVLSAGLTWRIPFMLAAAPNFILIPLFLLLVKEVKIGYGEPEIRRLYEAGLEYRFRINLREFLTAVTVTPTLIFIYLQGVPGTFPWGAIPYWAPTYFQEKWGLDAGVATLIIFAAGIGMMIGYFVGGVLSDALLRRGFEKARLIIPFIGIIAGTFTVISLISYPYPYGDSSFTALLPVIMLGVFGMVFVTFSAPNVPAILSEITLPEHRGTVFGLFNITDNIGSAIGPTLAAAFMAYYESTGLTKSESMYYGLLLVSLLWIACALLWLPAFKTYKRDKEKLRKALAERVGSQAFFPSRN